MDPTRFSDNLRPSDDGFWVADGTTVVSFPRDGHAVCAEIEAGSFWHRHRNRCIIEVLRAFPPNGPILDVGGGNGVVAKALQTAGFEAALLEPGVEGAANAQSAGLSTVIRATFEAALFRSASLPAVGLFDVLEHIENDRVFLRRIRTALRPGGRIYITVPACRWLWSAEDRFAGHFRRYTPAELTSRVREAGFDVDYETYFFAPLVPLILIKRTLPSLLGLMNGGAARMNDIARWDHAAAQGLAGWTLTKLLELEFRRLRRLGGIPLGSSCLMVAKAE